MKWARRRPAIAALSALVVLVSLIGMGGVLSQWREAVVARRAAVEKAQAEAKARAEATHLATNLQGQTYSLALALAQREWEAANIAQVQRLLDLCAPRLRRWEWDRLRHLCHLDERTIPAPGNHASVTFLCWSPDGTRLAGLSDHRRATRRRLGTTDYHANAQIIDMCTRIGAWCWCRVRIATWDPPGQQLLVYKDGTKRMARVDAGHRRGDAAVVTPCQQARESRTWPGAPMAVAWRSRARYGTGSNLRVWDARTGKGERVLAGHQDQVYAVAWSTDSKRLASASEDGTIRVWDPDTGASVLTLTGHAGVVKAVAWSLDGSRLATGGDGPDRSHLGRPNRAHDGCPERPRRNRQRRRLAS